jgi:hypothetical protein
MRSHAAIGIGILFLSLAAPWSAADDNKQELRASLVTVEGTIRAVSALPGEGELAVVAVSMVLDTENAEELTVLLAPESAMSEIGFVVEPGDRCRIRVFRPDEGPAKAHKVLNISRGTMVRLRTLRQIPLWDGRGSWQGGPCRSGAGGNATGHRHRGGR